MWPPLGAISRKNSLQIGAIYLAPEECILIVFIKIMGNCRLLGDFLRSRSFLLKVVFFSYATLSNYKVFDLFIDQKTAISVQWHNICILNQTKSPWKSCDLHTKRSTLRSLKIRDCKIIQCIYLFCLEKLPSYSDIIIAM